MFRTLVGIAFVLASCARANAGIGPHHAPLFQINISNLFDTTRYPLHDRYGDPYTYDYKNPFYFQDTGFIKRTVEYDPIEKRYYIIEKIGNQYYRIPTAFTMEEFIRLKGRQDEEDYFRARASMMSNMNRKIFKPKIRVTDDLFNRILGTGKIDIRPSGYVDFLVGYSGQTIKNPTLPERARKNGTFDFNMNSQFQVDANIGDKLKIPINYNTQANFGFENQLKLDFRGKDDDIVKQFQLGNTNFSSRSTLIPGIQNIFGIKTQIQLGRLFITGVLANQQSQRQTLALQGGSSLQQIYLRASEYDENRHFLLAQYFRNNFNNAMGQLPVVRSQIQILKMEVWVTNRIGATTDTRDIVAFQDLGERNPYNPNNTPQVSDDFPRNGSNNLYDKLVNNPNARNSSLVQSILTSASFGLQPVQDFEKTFARKLAPTDYTFNPQIGFISLNQQLQPDEVLGVAFQYVYNGKPYQVGEFSQDVPPDTSGASQRVLFLKLLKATSQRTNLPIWDLMMKNVYSVGYGQLERQDFSLDVLYEEPSLGQKVYLPADSTLPAYKGRPIIQLINADRLNDQNDPYVNGKYDFIEGFTVISSQSRIVFPVLEPFGHDMDYVFPDQARRDRNLFYPLYDTIKAIAQTYANLDRYKIFVKSKSSGSGGAGSGDYQLGYNIPRGSVMVTAGGQTLVENVDYEINYDLGTLRVTNAGILASGIPVNIQFENNQNFGLQPKSFMGLRLDYIASRKLTIGGTIVRLGERPFFVKQAYGDDPVRNTMFGLDVDYRSDWPRLTKWLDKLPFYSTKAMSSITGYTEVAVLKPGHPPQIGKKEAGQVYIDDFEGTRAGIDLRFPLINWAMASVPQGNNGPGGFAPLFPESALVDSLRSGYNRAKIAWYNIESVLQEKRNSNNPLRQYTDELSRPEVRQVLQREIFPKRSTQFGEGLLTTFDIAYYPKDKGPYNFETDPARIDNNGRLRNPRQAWAGLMRNIDQTDFETGNIEYIEFWLQDPFIKNTANPNGGQLYFNLGNISEDILRDGQRQYENGLRTPTNNAQLDSSTKWGQTPANPLQVTNAFSNDPNDRVYQDVGYDGLQDTDERRRFSSYLASLSGVVNPATLAKAQSDPSGDNFVPYRDPSFDGLTPANGGGILSRYKNINSPHGNSPINNGNSEYVNAFTQYPDAEELNRDNTMNEVEEYFQYKVDIKPNMDPSNSPYITDVRTARVTLADGTARDEKWFLFRIPIAQYDLKVGNIPDFKSIRFIRMFLTNFDDSVIMRFGKLELVRNQWRKFRNNIDTTGMFTQLPNPDFVTTNVLAVNIEENDQRTPIPYRIPPGIERQQQLSNNNVALFLNEQSVSLQVCGLPRDEARGIFKTLNMDMTQYGQLSMFIHAERAVGTPPYAVGVMTAVVRLGNDFSGNYYEVKIPLKTTEFGVTDSLLIWPEQNNLDFNLSDLIDLKMRRNKAGIPPSQYYRESLPNGRSYAIIGNPSLGEVKGMLLGVENTALETVCGELWFNELRLSRLNEDESYAALTKWDIRLADLGSISLSASYRSAGFGTIEQRVNERSRENTAIIDASTALELGKLMPKKLGIQIPMYAGISKIIRAPKYDQFAKDLELKDVIKATDGKQKKDSIREMNEDVLTIKTVTFTNVKKLKTDGKRPKFWSVTNFDFNYSYIQSISHNPLVERDELRRTRGAVGYTYAPQVKTFEPFRKLIKSKSKWLGLIRDINFNPAPSQISFKADLFRQYGETRIRTVGTDGLYKIPPTFNKFFTFDRYYVLQWNLTRSINIDYTATNLARVDEPFGKIDTKQEKDSIRKNLYKGGRNTNYFQDITITYNLPTNKIPLLDWTTIRASYNAKYNWLAGSLLARQPGLDLGHTLANTQTRTINGEFKFEDLYQKWRFLRGVYNTAPKPVTPKNDKNNPANSGNKKNDTGKNKKDRDKKDNAQVTPTQPQIIVPGMQQVDSTKKGTAKKQKKVKEKKVRTPRDPNDIPEVGGIAKGFFKLLTSLKRVGVQYTEDFGTTLPGWMDSTQFVGHNFRSGNPGFGYIFGYQPDTSWINRMGQKGLFSHDTLISALIQQRYNQRLNITAQISPFRDFNIDVNLDKTYDKQYSELFKDTSRVDNVGLTRLNPYATGSFSVSYISFQTLFTKFNPNEISETFKKFEANRLILSQRLSKLNGYQGGLPHPTDPNYFRGYGRYAQDVVIPAFIAAYTDKDPNKVGLIKNSNPNLRSNPFSNIIPKPNWTVTYTGLSRIAGLDKIFTNFSLRHGYHSTFGMNSFNTGLLFQDPFRIGYPVFIDPLTNNYVPFFLIPNITISEAFDPLIELDMTFTNQMTFRFEYKKSRQLSLSLIDYQLAENRSEEVTFGFNWRRKGVPIIKKLPFMKKELDNDVTFRMDFSLRDDATSNSKLDQNQAFGTAGQKVIRIAPSIDYVVNNRINVKLYFEQNRSIPKISNSFPVTNTRGGLQIRVSLTQ